MVPIANCVCQCAARTISLASTRVPTMRTRTCRPFTRFCCECRHTYVCGGRKFRWIGIGVEFIVHREKVGRYENTERPDFGKESHLVDVGDFGVDHLAVELR